MPRLTPTVQHLLLINLVIFVAFQAPMENLPPAFAEGMYLYTTLFKSGLLGLRDLPAGMEGLFHPVQLLTHFFTHHSLFHFIFNMLALASLGPAVETVLGSRRFLYFYLFCGLAGGTMIAFLDPSPNPVIGASGAIFGVMAAFAWQFPYQPLSFFFLPPLPARTMVLIIAAISALLVALQATGANLGGMGVVSHFGHLAGMAAAILFYGIERFLPLSRK